MSSWPTEALGQPFNWICFDSARFADGLDVECEETGIKNDFRVFGFSSQKDGVVVNRDGKTVGRAGFCGEFRSSAPGWLGL